MSEKYSLLFPNQKLDYKKLSDLTVHDIGMDSVLLKLSKEKNEQTYITNVMKLVTADAHNAQYRSDVFDDIYRNKAMREELLELLDRVNFLKEYGSYKHDGDHEPGVWDLVHRLEEIRDYIDSTWTLTADTYITSFEGDASSINTNGYTLYINGVAM